MTGALIACCWGIDQTQQAFRAVDVLRCVVAVLRADVHRAPTGKLVLFENFFKLKFVVIVKKHVVPDQRKAGCWGIDRPGDSGQGSFGERRVFGRVLDALPQQTLSQCAGIAIKNNGVGLQLLTACQLNAAGPAITHKDTMARRAVAHSGTLTFGLIRYRFGQCVHAATN